MSSTAQEIKILWDAMRRYSDQKSQYTGFTYPPDPYSGVIIDGKEYPTLMSSTGCFFFMLETGELVQLSTVKKEDWEWVNINEKHLQHFKTCYRTPGGTVEVWTWLSINDELEIRRERHNITDSTDINFPVGTEFETAIPGDWVQVDCDLPDMTERDIMFVGGCYKTPDGKVEIEGIESIDDKIGLYKSVYRVLQSTDPNNPAGKVFQVIPDEWFRIVCDFPDQTQRTITPINNCYATGNGKVRVEGYAVLAVGGDEVIATKYMYFSVVETTDNNHPVGQSFTSVPEDWDKIVCDFYDRTERDTEVYKGCYATGGGKVELKHFVTFNGAGDITAEKYIVLRSTDPAYTNALQLDKIPSTFTHIECDFASLTERHIVPLRECYEGTEGRLFVEGIALMDNNLATFQHKYVVQESTIESIPEGSKLDVIPDGLTRVPCRCNCC